MCTFHNLVQCEKILKRLSQDNDVYISQPWINLRWNSSFLTELEIYDQSLLKIFNYSNRTKKSENNFHLNEAGPWFQYPKSRRGPNSRSQKSTLMYTCEGIRPTPPRCLSNLWYYCYGNHRISIPSNQMCVLILGRGVHGSGTGGFGFGNC